MALPEFTYEEVAAHNSSDSLWVAIEGKVYDVTEFQNEHPGGQEVLLENAGKDATAAFQSVGHSPDAINLRDEKYLIGTLSTGSKQPPPQQQQQQQQQQQRQQSSVGSCCGRENCRGQMYAGVGAVLVAAVAIGLGIFLYKRYQK